jgi:hypothetical protein
MDGTLATVRPKFLCEKILGTIDEETARKQDTLASKQVATTKGLKYRQPSFWKSGTSTSDDDSEAVERSSHSLKGVYLGLQEKSASQKQLPKQLSTKSLPCTPGLPRRPGTEDTASLRGFEDSPQLSVEEQVLASLIEENQKSQQFREIFDKMDEDGNGTIDLEEFVTAYQSIKVGVSRVEIETIFYEGT